MKTLFLVTLIATASLASQVQAGSRGCCPKCGCSNIKKVCCLKQETKKTTTYKYDYVCEDFCVPGPSPVLCKKKVFDCESCLGFHFEKIWGKPCDCGCPRTRKLLVKVPVTKEKKVWACEVKRVCCGCGCAQSDAKATAEVRAHEIKPTSAEQPIVLDEHSEFEEGVPVVAATGSEEIAQADLEAQGASQAAAESKPQTLWERVLSK